MKNLKHDWQLYILTSVREFSSVLVAVLGVINSVQLHSGSGAQFAHPSNLSEFQAFYIGYLCFQSPLPHPCAIQGIESHVKRVVSAALPDTLERNRLLRRYTLPTGILHLAALCSAPWHRHPGHFRRCMFSSLLPPNSSSF